MQIRAIRYSLALIFTIFSMNISYIKQRLYPASSSVESKPFEKRFYQSLFKPSFAGFFKLPKIEPIDLVQAFELFFKDWVEGKSSYDPIEFSQKLVEKVPLKTLEKMTGESVEDLMREVELLLPEAKLYLEAIEKGASHAKGRYLSHLGQQLKEKLRAMGEIPWEEAEKNRFHERKMTLWIGLAAVGMLTGGALAAETLLFLGAMALAWSHFKPVSFLSLPYAKCLTSSLMLGKEEAIERKHVLDQVAMHLQKKQRVLLTGPAEMGKSSTAKAFAQAISRGDYPFFKGKAVFLMDLGEIEERKNLVPYSLFHAFEEVLKEAGMHLNQLILIVDEAERIFAKKPKERELLKDLLGSKGKFPYVVMLAKTEEQKKHSFDDPGFCTGFGQVVLKEADLEETLLLLSKKAIESPQKPLFIEKNLLKYIYEASSSEESAKQPMAALDLLKKCLLETEKISLSSLEEKLESLSSQIYAARAESALQFSSDRSLSETAKQLESEKEQERAKLDFTRAQIGSLMKAKKLRDEVQKTMYETLLKVDQLRSSRFSFQQKKALNLYVLLREFLGSPLDSYIQEKSKQLGVPLCINKELIDQFS